MKFRRRIGNWLRRYGIDPHALRISLRGARVYRANRRRYADLVGVGIPEFPAGRAFPCLRDRYEAGGVASGHYFHQDLLVAQWLNAANPQRHIDVGSRVDGFVAHVAAFREIEVLDLRPIASSAAGIVFHQRDITIDDPAWHGAADSVSCLHAIEHFGLGRYGDAVDPDAWRTGWNHLVQMARPGGSVYLSTMIGPQRVEFDAHRVFALPTLLELVAPTCEIVEFAYVDDAGELHTGADWTSAAAASTFGCIGGCGVFHLRRRAAADL